MFVNLNIWACDRKHFLRLKEIRMQALVSLSLSLSHPLSKFANSLDQKDLRRHQGQTGIPRINNVSERPTLRPMPRKNIIEP